MALIQSIGSHSHGTKGGYGADPHGDGVAEESRQMCHPLRPQWSAGVPARDADRADALGHIVADRDAVTDEKKREA
jgi:hypothetical protein